MSGKVYLQYDDEDSAQTIMLDFGSIQSINDSPRKSVSVTPIVSLPMMNSFPIETGNSLSYTVSFKRHDSRTTSYDDQIGTSLEVTRQWSNRKWYTEVSRIIDRWQVRTNGCKMTYIPGEGDMMPGFSKDGYLKNISRVYRDDYNEVITGSFTFVVGTMYINEGLVPSDAVSYDDMDALISDKNVFSWYLLYSGGLYNLITSMKIIAGPESPFEYALLEIPKKKLMEYAPELIGNIAPGRNEISLNIFGNHNMIVAQAKDKDVFSIKAYCKAWVYYNSSVLTKYTAPPMEQIRRILRSGEYGISFSEEEIQYCFETALNSESIMIPAGDNVWRVLQICAMMLRCKIFFADNCAYVVDYTIQPGASIDGLSIGFTKDGQYHINEMLPFDDYTSDNYPDGLTLFDGQDPVFRKRCLGSVDVDEEGIDPLINAITIRCSSTPGTIATDAQVDYEDDSGSIETFGKQSAGTIDLPELCDTGTEDDEGEPIVDPHLQGTTFAENYIMYRREPQRSITFSVKETFHPAGVYAGAWSPLFGPFTRIWKITDNISGESVSNLSVIDTDEMDGTNVPQKLFISSYTRNYPKGVCEYTFGTVANIDLSSSTSQINTAINSKR